MSPLATHFDGITQEKVHVRAFADIWKELLSQDSSFSIAENLSTDVPFGNTIRLGITKEKKILESKFDDVHDFY